MMTIFWSWQSDNHQPSGRYFVRDVLAELAAEFNGECEAEDAERPDNDEQEQGEECHGSQVGVDHDTLGVGGSPPIADTILRKIREAAVFVADVTPVGSTKGGKRLPNPNVMIELGYAVEVLKHERIVLVMNQAEEAALRHLPFDLRHWRAPVIYSLRRDATDEVKVAEAKALKDRLRTPIAYSLKAAARDRRQQRSRTHREPKLRIALEPANASPCVIKQTVGDLGLKTLDAIKAGTPLLPLPTPNRVPGSALTSSSMLPAFGYTKPVSLWSSEEVESYNRTVEHYYREYQAYLDAATEHRRMVLRSFRPQLQIVNEGTAPATEIDVNITFPKGLVLYHENEDLPAAPKPPEPPPLDPLLRGKAFARVVPTEIPRLWERHIERSTWLYPEERRVHYRCEALKHHHRASIDEFFVSFETTSDIRIFEAEYVITANEPVEPIVGKVRFEFSCLDE